MVSVPFTRGTPPWLLGQLPGPRSSARFSPLHEGDTSVAHRDSRLLHRRCPFQSPSRGGHLRGLSVTGPLAPRNYGFSPLHEGDTSVATRRRRYGDELSMFQSPSRGGHLRGGRDKSSSRRGTEFQSPSRGGHLRGVNNRHSPLRNLQGFSPLHEGDTSVARYSTSPTAASSSRFSPLHEGDTSVAWGA